MLNEGCVNGVVEEKRMSDRILSLRLEIEEVMLNVVSVYGCQLEGKETI